MREEGAHKHLEIQCCARKRLKADLGTRRRPLAELRTGVVNRGSGEMDPKRICASHWEHAPISPGGLRRPSSQTLRCG